MPESRCLDSVEQAHKLLDFDRDQPYLKCFSKVSDALNKPPTTRASARGGSSERTTGGLSTANLAGLGGSEVSMHLGIFLNCHTLQSIIIIPQVGIFAGIGRARRSGSAAAHATAAVYESGVDWIENLAFIELMPYPRSIA